MAAMWRFLALAVVVACGSSAVAVDQEAALLPPRPACEAYVGTGDLVGLDLASLCEIGVELAPLVDECIEEGSPLQACLTEVGSRDAFSGAAVDELRVGYEVGVEHIRRLEIWIAELDWCRFDKGEEACNAAIHDEVEFVYP